MTPKERLDLLDAGSNPAQIAKLRSGYAVLGDNQYLPGYCLLLASPIVCQLNDLTGSARAQFLADMSALGDALMEATSCRRVNYGIYGNLDPFLHVHIWPRYEWEHAEHVHNPPFLLPLEFRSNPETEFSLERHGELLLKIRKSLRPGNL
jgi:diadenosine tetraphosphate (Ap4A) HIT family hydrolase